MLASVQVVRRGRVAIDVLKLAVCAIIFTHGVHRYLYGEIVPLGNVLAQMGFPFAQVQAQLINLAETGGTLLIALGLFVRSMCAVLILIFITGIVLFHWQAGFFIVGPGEGGWEFSALLIASFAAVAIDYWPVRG
ncbi:DoxX family protein [Lysobacter sp. 2RAF19]